MPAPLELAEQLVLLLGRQQYVRDNAAALVADLEAQVGRQREELRKLNQRLAALSSERAKLAGDVHAMTARLRQMESTRDAEVTRLREALALALPAMETAVRAGLDDWSREDEDEIVAGHVVVSALRAALGKETSTSA